MPWSGQSGGFEVTKEYCAYCGAERTNTNTNAACPQCGREETTTTPPSNEPCAYCGARPTWAVTWDMGGQTNTVWLCAACDEAETKEIDYDLP